MEGLRATSIVGVVVEGQSFFAAPAEVRMSRSEDGEIASVTIRDASEDDLAGGVIAAFTVPAKEVRFTDGISTLQEALAG